MAGTSQAGHSTPRSSAHLCPGRQSQPHLQATPWRDDLPADGDTDVSVLDMSAMAMAVCRPRLGDRGRDVQWMAANVLVHGSAPNAIDI